MDGENNFGWLDEIESTESSAFVDIVLLKEVNVLGFKGVRLIE